MKKSKILHTLNNLPKSALLLLRVSLIICCITLAIAASLFAMVYRQPVFDYGLYMTACSLLEGPPILLLIAHFVIVAIIDFGGK